MSELLSPELFERIRGTKEGASWFAKLKEHATAAGRDESDAAIEGEMRSKLSGLLEGLAEKYKNIKLGALEKITQLQERASAVIDSALHTNEPPDIEALQQLFRDLDEVLDDLETKLEDVKPDPAETQGRPPSKPVRERPGQRGYTGQWPPEPPGPRPEDPANVPAWRYRRYLRDRFLKGEHPTDLLTAEGYEPHGRAAEQPEGRPGRSGGEAQRSVRTGVAAKEGFRSTENVELGTRVEPRTGEVIANVVDGVRENTDGGTDYLEVDKLGRKGRPSARYRRKLKAELAALKDGDTLEIWDSIDPSRRIHYSSGEPLEVVDQRTAARLPRTRTPRR